MIENRGSMQMDKHRTILALGLAAALLTGLTACGTPSAAGDGTSQGTQAQAESSTQPVQPQDSDSTQEFLDSITPETAEAKGVCGADLTWYYQDNVLVIKGTGEMTEYTYSDDFPWSTYREQIGTVIIDEGCTKISEGAFENCVYLSSVSFPDTLLTIDYSAFCNCESLKNITLPNNIVCIQSNSFENCNIEYVDIPASLTELYANSFKSNPIKAFYVDSGNSAYIDIDGVLFSKDLKTLIRYPSQKEETTYTIPDGTEVIGIRAFEDCYKIHELDIPDSVTTISNHAFDGTGIESFTIPASVTNIGGEESNVVSFVIMGPASIKVSITFLGDAPEMWKKKCPFMSNAGEITIYYSGSGFEPYMEAWADTSINWIKQ